MKKILPFLVGAFLLACTCSAPALSLPTPTLMPPVLPGEIGGLATSTTAEVNLTLVRLSPQDGGLAEQLHAAAPQAAALGQRMFVEFDAEW
jgi:hypothetical protein